MLNTISPPVKLNNELFLLLRERNKRLDASYFLSNEAVELTILLKYDLITLNQKLLALR